MAKDKAQDTKAAAGKKAKDTVYKGTAQPHGSVGKYD